MTVDQGTPYHADGSIFGKARRRLSRLAHRRPIPIAPPRAMLSISFDDAPLTATNLGADILEAHGIKGTFYAAAGLSGKTEPMGTCADQEDYVRLAGRGHEIACHTYSHLDCGRASAEAARGDVERNASRFLAWGLPMPQSFAYPFGDVSPRTKSALAPEFTSLRGLHKGLIGRGTDLNQLPAVGMEGQTGEAMARSWLTRARSGSAWLILYTHDVQSQPSPWGCTPEALDRLLTDAMAMEFEILTVRDAVARLTG